VPDNTVADGRIGIKCVRENGDRNCTVRQFELTWEELQVSVSGLVQFSLVFTSFSPLAAMYSKVNVVLYSTSS